MSKVFWGVYDAPKYIDNNAEEIKWSFGIDSNTIEKYKSKQVCLSNVYEDINRFNKAYDYCVDLSNRLIEFFTPVFNEIHNCSYNSSEWKLFLFKWIILFVSTLYDKYLKMRQMEGFCSNFYIISERGVDIATETLLFELKLRTVELNITLVAELMLFFGHEVFDTDGVKITEIDINAGENGKCEREDKRVNFVKKLIDKLNINCRTFVLLAENKPPLFTIVEYLSLGRIRIDSQLAYHISDSCQLSIAARKKLCKVTMSGDPFFDFVASIFGKYIPQSFVEYYNQLNRISEDYYPSAAKKVIDCNHFYFDEAFSLYTMKEKSRKYPICIHAHGGFGFTRNFLEIEMADCFYSWGFFDNRCKCKPMPALKLMNHRECNPSNGGMVLFADYLEPKYAFKYTQGYFFDMNGFLAFEREFILNLSEKTVRKSVFRIYPEEKDYNWHWREILERTRPDLIFDDYGKSFGEMVSQSSLLITTNLQTVWLESIRMGIPTIIVCPSEILSLPTEAVPFVEMLRSAKILLDNPREASVLIDSILGHEVDWWNEEERKMVVGAVKDRYAYVPRFSNYIWIRELCG